MTESKFVVSLDMELMWGVRDKRSKDQYGRQVLGEREAIPAMLDLFEREGIRATWAVVGMAASYGLAYMIGVGVAWRRLLWLVWLAWSHRRRVWSHERGWAGSHGTR